MKHRLHTAVFLLFCGLLVGGQAVWAQDISLRQRIKDRLAQRQLAKSEAPAEQALAMLNQPGDYRFSLPHEGLTRSYRLHLPKSYQSGHATPVLVALHGGGGNMDFMADDSKYGLVSKSEQAGFVLVLPSGYSKFPGGKLASWNAGNCCATARDQHVDDVGFIREVLNRVSQQVNVDYARVYATGMSNGAMMAYRLACEMSDVFSGIAAVAGTDNTQSCQPTMPVSVLHIHAQNDSHVLFNGGIGPDSVRASQVTDYVSVSDTIAKWSKLDGCKLPPRRVLERAGAWCETYAACAGTSEVQLCVTSSGGHSWPGGAKTRAAEPPSQAISAVDLMWDFFDHQSRETVQTQPRAPASAPAPSSQSK